jgi:ribonuclease HI
MRAPHTVWAPTLVALAKLSLPRTNMTGRIWTDGGSRNNPGKAACAYFRMHGGNGVDGEGRFLGHATSSVAEFEGLIWGLEKALELMDDADVDDVVLHSDSLNTIMYMKGKFQVRAEHLKPLYTRALALVEQATKPLEFKHVRRKSNMVADRLVNLALDREDDASLRLEYTPSVVPAPRKRARALP